MLVVAWDASREEGMQTERGASQTKDEAPRNARMNRSHGRAVMRAWEPGASRDDTGPHRDNDAAWSGLRAREPHTARSPRSNVLDDREEVIVPD
jgi:hypothetical protein